MFVTVLPGFITIFEDLQTPLPLITQVAVMITKALRHPLFWLATLAVGAGLRAALRKIQADSQRSLQLYLWYSSCARHILVLLRSNGATFLFNLNGVYQVGRMAVWNFIGSSAAGIQDVLVESSLDGIGFSSFAGAPTLFSRGREFSPTSAETFGCSPVTAGFLRFTVVTNYGTPDLVGLAEVLFDSVSLAAVPELDPTGAALPLSFCAIILALGSRRRR